MQKRTVCRVLFCALLTFAAVHSGLCATANSAPLPPSRLLTIDTSATLGLISKPGEVNWYVFDVTSAGNYIVATKSAYLLKDNYIRLYDPNMKLIGQGRWSNNQANFARNLTPGRYSIAVQSLQPQDTGSYLIRVASAAHYPKVLNLKINNGETRALSPSQTELTLNSQCTSSTHLYKASLYPDFSDEQYWDRYSSVINFRMIWGIDTPVIYFKVCDADGWESKVVSERITGLWEIGADDYWYYAPIDQAGVVCWYQFTADKEQYYFIDTAPNDYNSTPLADTYLRLYGPDGNLIAQDDNSAGGKYARIIRLLKPGTYTIKLQAGKANLTGDYRIRVCAAPGPVYVNVAEDLNGDYVKGFKVWLRNSVMGKPAFYMASESPKFKKASWKPYSAAPEFSLSSGGYSKYVYFKVMDAQGHQSNVITFYYDEIYHPKTLTLGKTFNLGASEDPYTSCLFNVKEEGDYLIDLEMSNTSDLAADDIDYYSLTLERMLDTVELYSYSTYSIDDVSDRHLTYGWHLTPGLYVISGSAIYYAFTIRVWQRDSTAPAAAMLYPSDGLNSDLKNVYPEWAPTTTSTITLNHLAFGKPVAYMASENPDFQGAAWKSYSLAPKFKISAVPGWKTIYFKIKGADGKESNAIDSLIYLQKQVPFIIDGPAITGIDSGDFPTLFDFSVNKAGVYTVYGIFNDEDTYRWTGCDLQRHGGSPELPPFLAKPGVRNLTTSVKAPLASYSLEPGKYRLNFGNWWANEGTNIGLVSGWGENLGISAFAIDMGAESTDAPDGTVTLNNACWGNPKYYRVNGGQWQPYSNAPKFDVSGYTRPQTLELTFEVANDHFQSQSVRDDILLQ